MSTRKVFQICSKEESGGTAVTTTAVAGTRPATVINSQVPGVALSTACSPKMSWSVIKKVKKTKIVSKLPCRRLSTLRK